MPHFSSQDLVKYTTSYYFAKQNFTARNFKKHLILSLARTKHSLTRFRPSETKLLNTLFKETKNCAIRNIRHYLTFLYKQVWRIIWSIVATIASVIDAN